MALGHKYYLVIVWCDFPHKFKQSLFKPTSWLLYFRVVFIVMKVIIITMMHLRQVPA